jgi:putative ABC transport system substrate-binding protein
MTVGRRDFITLLGGAAAAWPLPARAQQPPALPLIGFLSAVSAWESKFNVAAFRKSLSEAGFVDGRNVLIDYRWAEGRYERLPALAADLVRRQPAVIVTAGGSVSTLAVKAATAITPIVFTVGVDPVEVGLVASLNRPGGNLTGISVLANELDPKRLELLREVVPTASTIGLLVNPTNPAAEANIRRGQEAARILGLQLPILRATNEGELGAAFAALRELRAGALLISTDGFFFNRSEQLAALANQHAMPTINATRGFVAAGGLMSYGTSITDSYRLLGVYASRILKGEKPGDLPVQQSTKVELIINMKTAKALGLTVPLPLLGRADEVIE